MRCAIALFVCLLVAPVALFWGVLTSPREAPPASVSAPEPDPDLVRRFAALCQEHQQAVSDYQRDLVAAGPNAAGRVAAENHPNLRFFPRFLELAEQHTGDPLCPQILQYAVSHCAGAPIAPEVDKRILAILKRQIQCCPRGIRT
jgi:hypothetical protein